MVNDRDDRPVGEVTTTRINASSTTTTITAPTARTLPRLLKTSATMLMAIADSKINRKRWLMLFNALGSCASPKQNVISRMRLDRRPARTSSRSWEVEFSGSPGAATLYHHCRGPLLKPAYCLLQSDDPVMFRSCLLSVGVDASRRMTDLLPCVLRLRYKDNSGKFPS